MTFANNTPPANNNQRPKPIDRRFDDVDAMIDAAVRRVVGNSAATPASATAAATGADPIRDMVMAALRASGIPTDGKSDDQMLAEYSELVRKNTSPTNATATNSRNLGEFSGYDMNALMNQQKD